jgi:multiple sugar transport system substrate-binding protein
MFVQWNDSIPRYDDPERSKIAGNWAAAVMPGVAEADGSIRRAPTIGGWNMGMLADSPNQEAAWEFMLWTVSKEMERRLVTAQPPARNSVLSDPAVAAEFPEYDPMLESLQIAWGRPRIEIWTQMADAIDAALSQAVTGEKDPVSALTDVNQTLNTILSDGGFQQ